MIYDFSKNGDKRVVEILNSDVLGHNDFSILGITRNTLDEVKIGVAITIRGWFV